MQTPPPSRLLCLDPDETPSSVLRDVYDQLDLIIAEVKAGGLTPEQQDELVVTELMTSMPTMGVPKRTMTPMHTGLPPKKRRRLFDELAELEAEAEREMEVIFVPSSPPIIDTFHFNEDVLDHMFSQLQCDDDDSSVPETPPGQYDNEECWPGEKDEEQDQIVSGPSSPYPAMQELHPSVLSVDYEIPWTFMGYITAAQESGAFKFEYSFKSVTFVTMTIKRPHIQAFQETLEKISVYLHAQEERPMSVLD